MPSGVYQRTELHRKRLSEGGKLRYSRPEERKRTSVAALKNGFGKWMKGKRASTESKRKNSLSHKKEGSPKWKGDEVGYYGLHSWLRRNYGTPSLCEFCGEKSKRRYEWANLDGSYQRARDHWVRLCVPCHRELDRENPKKPEAMKRGIVK